ncbi:hypothetical protein EG329_005303 [Mollisiaceae sp. DMI_Dod_QoI]|nr:hypothetical protein EG329_005303 [Helotiales sp. DMI_Dod_QoI]
MESAIVRTGTGQHNKSKPRSKTTGRYRGTPDEPAPDPDKSHNKAESSLSDLEPDTKRAHCNAYLAGEYNTDSDSTDNDSETENEVVMTAISKKALLALANQVHDQLAAPTSKTITKNKWVEEREIIKKCRVLLKRRPHYGNDVTNEYHYYHNASEVSKSKVDEHNLNENSDTEVDEIGPDESDTDAEMAGLPS